MTDKQKALEKLAFELNKDIENLCEISKKCSFLEFLYFVYQLHWTRLLQHFPNAKNVNPEMLSIYSNSIEEALKYLISLVAKFGNEHIIVTKQENVPKFNLKLVQLLIKEATLINSKYETESLIKLFDVEVYGERNRHIKIDMSNVEKDENVKKIFEYYLRIDLDNNIKKNSKKNKNDLLKNFKEEYEPFADLFVQEMGVTLAEFVYFINKTLDDLSERITVNIENFDKLENGNIEINSFNTFFNFSKCYVVHKSKFLASFNGNFNQLLERLTFDVENFSPKELKFHQLTRQPFIVKNDTLIISPELIMDSLFTNIHYSLIEGVNTKDKYIAKQASCFLDKIALIAGKYGYFEVTRELDLFEGKNQIGDIDILFKNANNKYLLIEAKNHALPLDIYFKDVSKTDEHLKHLKEAWEKKVVRRVDHLRTNHAEYNIPNDYEYIVVSRFPEIISHYSDLLIFSIQELEKWFSDFNDVKKFEEFYKKYYNDIDDKFSIEELKKLQDDNLFFGEFGND